MENMKRAISAFMTLVLVLGMLPGVPMFAGAEEVETVPETVAAETTEAVILPEETETIQVTEETVPETTAAQETVPEETVPQQTQPQETVPAETVPEETVPQETVPAETVPEETVPEETVPQETAAEETLPEEENASQDALDGVVPNPVTNIQVSASTKKTFVGDKVQLKATVTPADASIPDVIFYVVDEGSDPIAYDEALLTEKGILRVEEAGSLVIAARATDLDTPHDSVTQEKDGTVKVTFVDYSMAINKDKDAIDQDNPNGDHWYGEEGSENLRLMTGESLKLSVYYMIDGVPSLPLTDPAPNVKWSLAEEDEKYASLKVSDDCRNVTVTAKAGITATKHVTLTAWEETLGIQDSIAIAVYPIPYKVGIYDEADVELTNKTVVVPLTSDLIEANQAQGYVEAELTAQVWPLEAEEPMVWTCSDSLIQVKHPDLDEETKDTTKATLRIYFQEGETTITVTSKNYPDVKSKLTIVRKRCLTAEEMDFHKDTEDLSVKGEGLVAGQSFQLEVYDIRDEYNPEKLTSETVKWSLAEGGEDYASITKEGKLTAKTGITEGAEITVICAVVDNEESCLELPVIIRPRASEVRILPGDLAEAGECALGEEDVLNGKTVAVDTAEGRTPFRLGFVVLPGDEYGARQEVKWTSSNKAIAAIDPDTDEIVWKGKNGTVTITAAATDGSGKKASVKLKFGVQIREMEIVKDEDFFLRSGQSWTFDMNFTPANVTDKSLTWTLVDEADKKYVTLTAGGKLTAKTVYEEHTVTIRATAKDGSGVVAETSVLIKPKNEGILTLKGYSSYVNTYENYVTKTTQTIPVGDSIDLEAYILGETVLEDVTWKVSSKTKAELSYEIGGSTTVTMLNTGTVTVTATSLNEPKKKATVTLKGVRMTDYIEWTHTHETTELACGKSLTLKAKGYDADGKTPSVSKLAWSIAPGGEAYAKVANGKVTAIAGALGAYDDPVDITVLVRATDGSGVEESYGITIYPIVQSVMIQRPAEVTPGTTTFVLETPGVDTVSMSAQVWPANALQDVTWKTSNKSVAEIDPDTGDLTCKKAGTVTVTATAKDGSGKKATYKLTIVLKPSAVYFDNEHFAVGGGKSLKIKPVFVDGNGDKITGKKVQWQVLPVPGTEDGTPYVTSVSGGTVKTRKVTELKEVLVVLRTQEKNEDWEFEYIQMVRIYPAASSVTLVDSSGDALSSIKWVNFESGGIHLDAVAKSLEGDEPYQRFNWKSSNKKIAEVDPMGDVIFHKTGTVTITVTAADGTGKKDTIRLVIRD